MNIVTEQILPNVWTAIDRDTYDGASDSRTRFQIGMGETPEEAIEDLHEEIEFDRS